MTTIGTAVVTAWIVLAIITQKSLIKTHSILATTWVIVSLYLNSGAFLKVGSVLITFDEVILVAAIITGLLARVPRTITKTYLLTALLLVGVVTTGVALVEWQPLHFLVMPPNGSWDRLAFGVDERVIPEIGLGNWLRVLRLMLFLVIYTQLEWVVTQDAEGQDRLRKVIVWGAVISAGIAMLEFLSWHLLGRDYVLDLIRSVFGHIDSQVDTPTLLAGGSIALQGLMREPSHFAASMLPALLILVTTECLPRSTRQFTLIGLLGVLVLSSALTGVLLVAFTGAAWVWHRRGRKDFIWLVGFGVVAAFASVMVKPEMVEYWYGRVLRSVAFIRGNVDVSSVTSEVVRLTSISHAVMWFAARPFFGIGLGSGVIHGALPNILSNVGLIGFLLWLTLLLRGNVRAGLDNKFILILYLIVLIPIGDIGYMYSANVAVVFMAVFRVLQARSARQPVAVPETLRVDHRMSFH